MIDKYILGFGKERKPYTKSAKFYAAVAKRQQAANQDGIEARLAALDFAEI